MQYVNETISSGPYASLQQTPPQANAQYFCTDAPYDMLAVNGAWVAYGPSYRCVIPPYSQFSPLNWSLTTTANNTNGYIWMTDPTILSNAHRLMVKSIPAPPYKIHIRFTMAAASNADGYGGIYWYSSASGQATMAMLRATSVFDFYNLSALNATGYTTIWQSSGNMPGTQIGGTYNLVVGDDGTNRTMWWNPDGFGVNLIPINGFPVARASFYTNGAPDKIGFGFANNSSQTGICILSWREYN
jgi:hypothetical protein